MEPSAIDQRYRANIAKYLAFRALRGAAVATSVVLWVIFLQRRDGLSLTQVAVTDVTFFVARFLFEIPTGVVADRHGRKISLAIGAGLTSLIWLYFAAYSQFVLVAIGNFIGGIAATFQSGAEEALLFESLQALGREDEYARLAGRATAVESASVLVFSLIVGPLAAVDLVLPIVMSSILFAATLVPILWSRETGRAAAAGHAAPGYGQILRRSIAALREHTALRWATAYLAILTSLSFYALMFLQPYAVALGVPVAAMGIVMAAMQAVGMAGSLAVSRLQRLLGSQAILFGVPALLVPCLALIGAAAWPPVLAVVGLAVFLFALTQPVLLAAIQGSLPDEVRATLLSLQALIGTAFVALTEPSLGWLSDRFGVHTSYYGMAALLAVFCVLLLGQGRRRMLGYTQAPDTARAAEV